MKSQYSLFFRKKLLLLITIILGNNCLNAQNILTNGDFESGGSGVGFFVHDYTLINPLTGTSTPGTYARTTNPTLMNSTYISGGDHTTGTGNMLVIDGRTAAGGFFWTTGNTGGAILGFTAGTTYTFTYWIKSVSNVTPRAQIQPFFVNAASINPAPSSITAPLPADGWQRVSYSFVATANNVMVRLQTTNSGATGCDFAVDDFSITQGGLPFTGSYTTVNPTCPDSADGSITVTLSGGEFPYGTYNLTGTATQSNSTGIFTGLGPGTYNVSVFDSAGAEYSATNIVLTVPNDLQLSAPTTVLCGSGSIPITASAGDGTYTWTANPPDSSITNPSAAVQNVSPAVTTTYTVTSGSVSSPTNLVVNGDFTQGNVGFTTGYTRVTNPNPFGVQASYDIVTNPNAWFSAFSPCGDHTTGTGNMMVFDGATNAATSVWCTASSITVQPNTSYTFSYYVATVAAGSPARLEVFINGVSLGTPVMASSSTCVWTLVSHTWNSGPSTVANVCIFNRETSSGGNDFALDDISLVETLTCLYQKDITITVGTNVSPTILCGAVTSNSVSFNWNAVPGATGYTISYAINGGTPVNAGSVVITNYTVSSLNSTDNVTITVLPTGTGCFTATSQTCSVAQNCPTPVATVTQQPTCAVPTGTIVFTPPVQPLPSDLFISEVTDASVGLGALSYIEIFNGTGAPKNLANYKVTLYNNGNTFISPNCEITLSGTLNNNDVFVLALGSNVNQGGVIPDRVVANCAAFNTDDNVRLVTSTNVLVDTWGRNDGVDFTPNNEAGYTYRRLNTVVAPSTVWNPTDWTALDPEDYSDVGTYAFSPIGNYQYSIDGVNYQTSPTFTGVAPGTYYGTIKDIDTGCISTSITLIVNLLPVVPLPTVGPISYCQNATASPLTATPSPGGTLNWYGTNATGGTASSTAPTPSTTTVGATTYYVSQTIAGCESARVAIVVTVSNTPPSQAPQLVCNPANSTPTSVNFDFNNIGQTNFTYSYSIDGGTPVTGIHTSPSNFTVPGVSPGQTVTFTLTWNGVCASPLTASTTVPTFTQLGPYCAGQIVPSLPATSLNGKTGTWSPAVIDNINTTTYTFTPNAQQCASRTSMTIVVTPVPSLVITNPVAVCSPLTVDLTAAAVTAGSTTGGTLTYWTNSAATTALSNPNAVTTSGTYYIKLTVGSCFDIKPVTVTINPTPSLVITNPSAVCSPLTVDLTAAAVTAGSTTGGTLTYWTNSAATTALSNPNAVTTSGTYYIKLTVGSCFDIKPVTVTINPTPSLVITNPSAVCSPSTVDLTAAAVTAGSTTGGTLTYWTNSAATTALSNPNAVTTSGTYYIKLTVGSCFDIKPVTVTINPTPSLVITNPSAVCSPLTVDLTAAAVTAGSTTGGTLTYWTNSAATTALSNPNAVTTSGTYYIKLTVGSCFDIKPVTVTINPTPSLVITNPSAVCSPSTVDLTAAAVTAGSTTGGTLTYWTNSSATTALSNPNAVTTSGTYYIKLTVGSCFDIKPVTVTINPTPSLVITNPSAVCSPSTVDLTAAAVTAGSTTGGTLTYWTNSSATTALSNPNAVTTSGTYYIKLTVGSCFDIKPVTVTINPTPSLVITNPSAVCSPLTVDLTAAAVTAGSTTGGTLTYWTNSSATTALSNPNAVTTSGTYYIKLTVGSCFDIKPVTVIINPTPSLVITNPSAVCSPLTVDLTAAAVTAGSTTGGTLTYWTNSSATTALSNPNAVTTSGTYYIKLTVGSCFDIKPVTVKIIPEATVTINILENCNGNQVTVTSPLGSDYVYSLDGLTPQTSPVFTNLTAGNHFIVAIQTVGNCSSTPFNFVVNPVINDVVVNPNPPALRLCDPNNDGFDVFNLTAAINSITGGTPYLISYHETITDAMINGTTIPNPSLYPNINPWSQIIYIRVESSITSCFEIVELELLVAPTPEATVPSAYHLCDYTGAVGFESFNLLSYIPQILGGINPLTHTVTFYTSLPQAELGTGFIATPGNYTNGTINQETIYVRVENNTTGCYDIVTLDLIVDPLPQSLQPNYPQYSLCDYDRSRIGYEVFDLNSKVALILDGQTGMRVTFYPSLLDAQNNSNAITNLNYENTIIYVQTLGIRLTNETTGCYVISTMDIRVEPLPEPIPPTSPYTICDDNQDGFSEFDLSTLVNDILGGATYLVSFHETLTNAETNAYALPMLYPNIHPFVQIIYLRAEDPDTHCVSIIPIELNVNPSPVAPISLAPLEVCDTDANDQDGSTLVNLTVRTSDVLAQQPLPASSYVVTYYTNPTDAGLENNPIVNVLSHPGSNGDTIWVRVENIATGCYNLGSFELIIGIPLVVPVPQPINQCDTAPNDQYAVFDLTVRTITPLSGYTIQYYPSLSAAQSSSNEITNITSYQNTSPAVQTLGVKITSPQGCVSYTTLNIRVLPVPTPNTNPQVLPAVCENAPNSGQATVDLTQNQAYIINGDPNVTLHYFPTLTDLENNTNEITNPSAALVGDTTLTDDPIGLVQYVYIAVSSNNNIDYSGRNCYTVVAQGYIINPLPIVDMIGTTNVYQICESDPTGNDNIEVFDLTSQIPDLLEGNVTTPTSNYSVAFYEDAALTSLIGTPSAYTNTSNPQTIYVVITNTTTGCVSQPSQFDIQVNPKPIIAVALSDLDFTTCDDQDGVNDGQALHQYDPLSLSGSVAQILGATQLPTDYDVTFYYNSQANAESGLNAVDATAAVQTGTYWVRVEDKATGCYITGSFSVVVEQLAEPNVVANTTIACVDFGDTVVNNTLILDSQVAGNYTFEWYADGVLIPGAISSTLTVTEMTQDEVEFSVIAISNSPGLGCRSDDVPQRTKITITRSGVASNVSYTVSNAFSDLQTITITYDGYGEYHFSLDDGPILDNGGVFTDVPMGEHTVHVWDMRDPNYSCGVVSISGVQVIDYPHYFTPNGDGIHDTWNIKGLKNFADETKIYIFDRYGKLLKQISSAGEGWDGTFNGQLMPSSDYWFRVEYPEQGVMKEFKAHFSLKR